jgi:hypothetical protein
MEGEKMKSHRKGFFEVKVVFSSKILTSPLFEETHGTFLSLPLFFSLFISLLRLLRGFDDI